MVATRLEKGESLSVKKSDPANGWLFPSPLAPEGVKEFVSPCRSSLFSDSLAKGGLEGGIPVESRLGADFQ